MVRFKLIPYIIRVQRTDTGEPLILDNVNGDDFLKILKGFFSKIQKTAVFNDILKTVSLGKKQVFKRNICGTLKSGEYGVEADFFNVKNGTTITQARKQVHSEIIPFFFHFYIPKGKDRGILILQYFKVFGVKTLLERMLNNHFHSRGITIQLNRLISHDLLKQLDESRLVELRLIRYDIPRDIADQIHDGRPEEIMEERIFRIKRKGNLQITRYLRDLLSNTQARYYEVLRERYNELKAVVIKSGSTVTLTFGEENMFRESMPLVDKDMPLEGGFPSFEYLREKAKEYSDYLKENIGDI